MSIAEQDRVNSAETDMVIETYMLGVPDCDSILCLKLSDLNRILASLDGWEYSTIPEASEGNNAGILTKDKVSYLVHYRVEFLVESDYELRNITLLNKDGSLVDLTMDRDAHLLNKKEIYTAVEKELNEQDEAIMRGLEERKKRMYGSDYP